MKLPILYLKNALISLIIIFLSGSTLKAQSTERNYRIAFYNLENLFDPIDDSLKNDEEFTPEGLRNWSEWRYHEKSNRMAKAILSIGDWQAPDIIGVAEIEDRRVLDDLVHSEVLRKFNYGIVHFESPDHRGIDVGMLYRKESFTPIYSKNIPVKLSDDPHFATRDILYVKGVTASGDTLHLMYCHWPSRYGGQAQSEPKRIQAALTVRANVDSIWQYDRQAYIIIAGDLNDEWNNLSVARYLNAHKDFKSDEALQLIDLMARLDPTKGSHRFHGTWSYLDQIIVSNNLLDSIALDVEGEQAHVCYHDFLLETDEKYPGQTPYRTFIGMRYHGGFSDHLPVFINLTHLPSK